jgi:hypothetical protein
VRPARDNSERFRRVRGYREIELLVVALQRFEADPEHTFDAQVA